MCGVEYNNVFIVKIVMIGMVRALDDLDRYLGDKGECDSMTVVGVALERIAEGINEGATLEEVSAVCSKYSVLNFVGEEFS